MLSVIASRGPDGTGRHLEPEVEFGFKRLAINDLSATGNQPMYAEDRRIVSMLNGEIYNFRELKRELQAKGRQFLGTSDAEIIPHGYAEWGLDLFRRLRGMFAIALYDHRANSLILARDHFGIKPLYYARTKDGVAFSSSARAVSLHPEVGQTLNHDSLTEALRFRYVLSGRSLYRNVQTLLPGQLAVCKGAEIGLQQYWQRPRFNDPVNSSVDELVEKFSEHFLNSVRREMAADVPLGVLLSGGIDSGAVLAAAYATGARDLSTFTYDMGGELSEIERAQQIAADFHASHHAVIGRESDFVETFTSAVQCMDLPVGDAIIAPTYQLLGEVSKQRKVVLTGEGADELLAGYAHVGPLELLGRVTRLGVPSNLLAAAVGCVPLKLLDAIFPYDAALGESGKQKLIKIVRASKNPAWALDYTTSVFDVDEIAGLTALPRPDEVGGCSDLSLPSLIDWGFDSWLPNQILNKMDQLSMAHGIEARVPFVSVELYELVATLPKKMLLSSSKNKRVLRETLKRWGYRHHDRPKRAFYTPLTPRHQRELESLAQEWLSVSTVNKHGVVSHALVRDTMDQVRRGDFLASKRAASLAALHIWLDQDFRR